MVYLIMLSWIGPVISANLDGINTEGQEELLKALDNFDYLRENEYIKLEDVNTRHLTDDVASGPLYTDGVVLDEPNIYTTIRTFSANTVHSKSKRGWEEFRHWRRRVPKRKWEVVNRLMNIPEFRSKYLNYLRSVKRSKEIQVDIPIQPNAENVPWMLDDIGYNVDINEITHAVPDTKVDDAIDNTRERRWEDSVLNLKANDNIQCKSDCRQKRGWEDISRGRWNRRLSNNVVEKRGWEDIARGNWNRNLNSNFNNAEKRGWEDIGGRSWNSNQHSNFNSGEKRGLENIGRGNWNRNLHSNLNNAEKSGWEDIGRGNWNRNLNSNFNNVEKRGWEDIGRGNTNRNLNSNIKNVEKRGWEDIGRANWNRKMNSNFNNVEKRGWVDVTGGSWNRRVNTNTNVKPVVERRDWEDIGENWRWEGNSRVKGNSNMNDKDVNSVISNLKDEDKNRNEAGYKSKRGWEDIRRYLYIMYMRGNNVVSSSNRENENIDSKNWELNTRNVDADELNKRGWEDIRDTWNSA